MKKFITILIVLAFILIVSPFAPETKAESVNTYTESVNAKANGQISFYVHVHNFDDVNFGSLVVTVLDGDTVVASQTENNMNRARDYESHTEPSEKRFTYTFDNLEPGKAYTLRFELTSPYDVHYDNQLVDEVSRVVFTSLGRMKVTKTWYDGNNTAGNRPSAEAFYTNNLKFKINDQIVTPDSYRIASTYGNQYTYYIYGLNIRNIIEAYEDPIPDQYLNVSGEKTQGYDVEESSGNNWTNTSIASLVNDVDEYFKIRLKKVDADTNEPLENVEFEVINNSDRTVRFNNTNYAHGEVLATIKTGADGVATLEGLPMGGRFIVKETKTNNPAYEPPQNYMEWLVDSIWMSNPTERLHDLGTITNKKIKFGGLSIKKVDEADPSVTLPGAVFEIHNISWRPVVLPDGTEIANNGIVGTFETDSNGEIHTGNILPTYGTYRIKEVTAPSGYAVVTDTSREVRVQEGIETEFVVSNKKITESPHAAYLEFTKELVGSNLTQEDYEKEHWIHTLWWIFTATDPASFNPDGIELSLYKGSLSKGETLEFKGSAPLVQYLSYGDKYSSPSSFSLGLKAGESATMIINDASAFKDITEFGFQESEETWNQYYYKLQNVVIQNASFRYFDGTFPMVGFYAPIVPLGADNSPSFRLQNFKRIPGQYSSIQIRKEDNNGNELLGCKFAVVNANEEPITLANGDGPFQPGEAIMELELFGTKYGRTGMVLPVYLSDGETKAKYHVYEIQSPEGYSAESLSGKLEGWESYPLVVSTDNLRVNDAFKPTVINYKPFKLIVKKIATDTGNLLPDAVFDIVNASEGPVKVKDKIYQPEEVILSGLKTDANGIIETEAIFPLYTTNGLDAVYLFKETKAPDGYKIVEQYSNSGFVFGDGMLLDIFDTPITKRDVEVSKVILGQGTELAGADLTVSGTDAAGNDVRHSWTSTGEAKVLTLAEGTYTLTENQAPLGYAIAESIDFVVTADGVLVNDQEVEKIVMEDALKEEFDIEISKVDLNGQELPGAQIQILGEDGDVFSSWISINEPKKLRLTEGTYVFHEVAAPNGYEVVTDITFKVTEDGTVEVTKVDGVVEAVGNKLVVTDQPKTQSIVISKVNLNGKELPGAQIQILGEDGDVFSSWISTNEPKTLSLPAGTYVFHEVAAPDGYEAVTDITFKVTEDGIVEVTKVTGVVEAVGNKLIVTDQLKNKEIEISKVDLNGSELIGAKIQILDDKGNLVTQWVSEATPKKLKLNPGTYTFREVAAPNGYEAVTDIVFQVDEKMNVQVAKIDGVVEAVENKLIVTDRVKTPPLREVPKTSDSGFGMLLLLLISSLGTTGLLYRKKEQ